MSWGGVTDTRTHPEAHEYVHVGDDEAPPPEHVAPAVVVEAVAETAGQLFSVHAGGDGQVPVEEHVIGLTALEPIS